MGRCIVVLPLYAGEAKALLTKAPGDILICADAGYARAIAFGFKPDLVIGDFDSMSRKLIRDCPVLSLPTHKDDTDTGICMKEGRRRGYRDFLLAGGIGGRLDHTISNLQLLYDASLRGEKAVLLGENNEVRVLTPGRYTFPQRTGWKLSLLAYSSRAEGVCIRGTAYAMENGTLTNRCPLGVSNEFSSNTAEVSFQSGALLALYARDALEPKREEKQEAKSEANETKKNP